MSNTINWYKKQTMPFGKWYVDSYNQLWLRINQLTVWNKNIGYGHWDNGKGLEEQL